MSNFVYGHPNADVISPKRAAYWFWELDDKVRRRKQSSSEKIQFPAELKKILNDIDEGLVKHPDEDENDGEEMKFLRYKVRLVR
jgi:hypothetical protein